jgi:tripartite-type tricarboxylate transporter receptor subunit TctC
MSHIIARYTQGSIAMNLNLVMAVCALMITVPATLFAQAYPSKPIRLIVPFPPAGPTDICGRAVAKAISDGLGQPVTVENRAGAGGTIGTDAIAKAPADGYTLGIPTISTLGIAPYMFAKLGYEPLRDFTPITNVCATTSALVAHPSFAPNNVTELMAYVKANPGKVSYASPGVGTILHLGVEYFASLAGLQLHHVPYKGASPAMVDVLAGIVPLSADASLTAAAPNVKSGKLKVVAILSKTRSPLFPEVATIAESGYPDFDMTVWFGLVGPAGLPSDMVARLNAVVVKGLRQKEVAERFAAIGADVIADTPEQFATTIRNEVKRWGPVVRSTGIKAE